MAIIYTGTAIYEIATLDHRSNKLDKKLLRIRLTDCEGHSIYVDYRPSEIIQAVFNTCTRLGIPYE